MNQWRGCQPSISIALRDRLEQGKKSCPRQRDKCQKPAGPPMMNGALCPGMINGDSVMERENSVAQAEAAW